MKKDIQILENSQQKYNWVTESGIKEDKLTCQYLTYVPEDKYTWNMNSEKSISISNLFVSKAEAQNLGNNVNTNSNDLLSVPLYIIVFVFLLFTVTMSLIYLYHWMKFNLNDPFIKNFSLIYFFGLCALLIPLIFNLIV